MQMFRAEQAEHGDIVLVNAPDGYEGLWRKSLVYLKSLVDWNSRRDAPPPPRYVMHADDDSFVRLPLLMSQVLAHSPTTRFYWGYIWDQKTGNRVTAPIRDPKNKSYLPEQQYPLDSYPPFASGCGFILSWDLVLELTQAELPDYRLLDPPFGIHLCGDPPPMGRLITTDQVPIQPVHDERVRPYRPLPTFRKDTIVQHYLKPAEFKPFFDQAVECDSKPDGQPDDGSGHQDDPSSAPELLYQSLVDMGIYRR
jgi:galactosylxylosylprotein 3-beta-galactosyltransferase